MNMWKKLLMGSLVLGTVVSCNGSVVQGMVPVAVTPSVEGLRMSVDYTKNTTTGVTGVTVTRNSGTVKFAAFPGSAGFQVQRYKIETFDESLTQLATIEHTLAVSVEAPPLSGTGAGQVKTTTAALPQDPLFPDEVQQHYVNLCLSNYLDPNRGVDDPVCPKLKVRFTFTGISLADQTTKNVTATFDFQPGFSYTVTGG
ncbi:hypothetical protein [Deinococcus cellulosilyticus]|uniref:Lipoprotein n=1 Tax=Deinococcus cellulosilyticus (strain DSM 18568 / NBRC 106333 / KACC 11606 / 5516J-15) TaxID=1223518 RepID=A0A511NB32_DEIC1|nr:hypothetical protein [Deinococcus cellulosilyticus]GEM49797.1 hypothetical protein DC3_54320 [Deinococcus cellulosilyticus NBRC 106333 = KACC 11606]